MDYDRIEIDRGNVVGMVGRKLRQPDHEVGERRGVRRRHAAIALEQLGALEAADQRAGGGVIERHGSERDIAQRLDQNAAEADHQQQSPRRVAADPENDLAPGRRHRLHQHAVDVRRRRVALGGGQHTVVSRAHDVGAGEI